MTKYRIHVSFDEINFFWIVIDNGRLMMNPTKEDLHGTKLMKYNKTNICDRCREEYERYGKELTDESILFPGNARREFDIKGNWARRWDCYNCWGKYDPNSISNMRKSLRNCRTGNQNASHSCTKGNQNIEVVCELYGYIDLNKKYDNYTTEIDCQDSITGLYYQIRGKRCNPINRRWDFGSIDREWHKDYEDMICFCMSEDGKRIERIYRIPFKKEIKRKRKSIGIYRNHMRNSKTLYWYEKYRVNDEEELKKANEILQKILEKGE